MSKLLTKKGRECIKCGEYKHWEEFRALKKGINGKTARCKTCMGSPNNAHDEVTRIHLTTPAMISIQDFCLGRLKC